MNENELSEIYRRYILCLNSQDWANLGIYVHEDVCHNGKALGLSGYRRMLEEDFRAIPDLFFHTEILIADPPRVASRLHFDCTPAGMLFGLPVNGRRIRFAENVFYEFRRGRIVNVWSIIDKAGIEAQLY